MIKKRIKIEERKTLFFTLHITLVPALVIGVLYLILAADIGFFYFLNQIQKATYIVLSSKIIKILSFLHIKYKVA